MSLPSFHADGPPHLVAVVDADPKLRTRLAMQLGDSARAGAFPSFEALEDRTHPGSPLVVVLGPSFADADLRGFNRLRQRFPANAVLVVERLETEVLQRALRAGISDVIEVPTDPRELIEAVERAGEHLREAPVPAPLPAAVPATTSGPSGRVITVFSPKGGAGKSVVACNLAVLLARNNPRPVALLDVDLQFGDLAIMLQERPETTVIDAVAMGERLDEASLEPLLITHQPSGVRLLAAPTEPALAERVRLEDLTRILAVLRRTCSHVIVDTASAFDDVMLGVLEQADDIVLIAGMDVPHVKNTKIALQTLKLLDIPISKVKLVLNRANSRVRLEVAEVERTLQMRADCSLPSDIAMPRAVNKGLPVVLDAPRSGVARSLTRFATTFAAQPAVAAGGQG